MWVKQRKMDHIYPHVVRYSRSATRYSRITAVPIRYARRWGVIQAVPARQPGRMPHSETEDAVIPLVTVFTLGPLIVADKQRRPDRNAIRRRREYMYRLLQTMTLVCIGCYRIPDLTHLLLRVPPRFLGGLFRICAVDFALAGSTWTGFRPGRNRSIRQMWAGCVRRFI